MPAQFNADLNPKNTGMSLGDMMKMGLYSAETDILNRQAQVAREKERELPLTQAILSKVENYQTDGKIDPDKVMPALMAVAPLTGPETIQKLQTLATNQNAIMESRMKLTNQERTVFGQVEGALGQAKVDDPLVYINAYKTIAEQYPYNSNIAKLAEAKISNVTLANKGTHLWEQALRSSNQMMTLPEQQAAFAPKAGTAQIGGQVVGTVTQPSVEGRSPTVSTSPLGGGQPATTPSTGLPKTKVLPEIIKEDPDFNYTGPANPLNLNELQKESYAKGKSMLREAPILATAAEEGKQYVRKVEEVAGKASGAGAYKTAQDWARLIVAQPDLDTLRKNIAGVMVQNANTMGLNKTDSSRGDAATISGSDAISPEALRDIMQRADAQFTATTKFAEGLKKYREKRGEVNSALNADRFQSAWASNYDSRIFQLQNIRDSNYPEAVKKQRYESLTKSMSEKEFDELDKKAKAIDRLVEGSYK